MISVKNLTKKYGKFTALQDLNFDVAPGEIVGFLGANGAGKTTTMRILTGYLSATSGDVKVAGFDVSEDPLSVRKSVGYLPEHVPLYLDMRVEEYLFFRARIKGLNSKQAKKNVKETLEKCWLTDVRLKIIGTLSKGYRQRVGLADALLNNPKLLILDEPTIGLDPNQIIKIRDLIKDLGKEHTIFLSSHILAEVEMVSSKIIIIHNGTIAAQDTSEALRANFIESGQVHVEIKGADEDKIKHELFNIKHVTVIDIVPKKDEYFEVILSIEKGKDIREDIYKKVTEQGWMLRELKFVKTTLEDVFIHITTQEDVFIGDNK